MASFSDEHGPYPDHWTEAARSLWDNEPLTYRGYEMSDGTYVEVYNDEEWAQLQESFERGWMVETTEGPLSLSPEERFDARSDYFALTTTDAEGFDWDSYRDYLAEERYQETT